MDKWQQEFSSRVSSLRESWSQQFEAITNEQIDPVFNEFSDFIRRCDLQSSALSDQKGMRSFKFSLCEDAYAMVYFRSRGLDQVECDYECFLPRIGKVSGVKSSVSARNVERAWTQACLRKALDDLVARFTETRRRAHDAELALA